MKKEFINNLMVQMKTLQTKLDEEVEREKKEKEELKKDNWRKKFNSNAKLTGDINESILMAHFMKEGWDVFKNMSCTGPIDMFIYKREENITHKIDAKSSESSAYAELSKCKDKGIYTCYFSEEKQKVVMVKDGNAQDGYETIEI
tara:strand:- start:450 stop:884 length:435 start_codon:yes stop_codon:yes gene_type:complete